MVARPKTSGVLVSCVTNVFKSIFPDFCLVCNREGSWLCPVCVKKITPYHNAVCAVCRMTVLPSVQNGSRLCVACARELLLDGLAIGSEYTSVTRRLVHALKYEYIEPTSILLAKSLANAYQNSGFQVSALVPVPLHHRRFCERGFNQTLLLARDVSARLGIPVADIVLRTRYTNTQINLSRHERMENFSNAFVLKSGAEHLPSRVAIVDDVFTTGATLSACANVLRARGVQEVFGLVAAHG